MTANNSTSARSNGGLRKKKRHYDMCSNSLLVPFCMVACTLVGYLFGSGLFNISAKYKYTIIADNREIESKISSNTNYYYSFSNLANYCTNYSFSSFVHDILRILVDLIVQFKLVSGMTRQLRFDPTKDIES